MARHRSFGSEFKRHIAKEYLDGRAGLHELARRPFAENTDHRKASSPARSWPCRKRDPDADRLPYADRLLCRARTAVGAS